MSPLKATQIILPVLLVIGTVSISYSQTQENSFIITGVILDEEVNEGLPFAKVLLLKDDKIIAQAYSNIHGDYLIEAQNVDGPFSDYELKTDIPWMINQFQKLSDSNCQHQDFSMQYKQEQLYIQNVNSKAILPRTYPGSHTFKANQIQRSAAGVGR